MQNVFEADHNHLRALRHEFGREAAYDLLRVLVWCPTDPKKKVQCYVRGATNIHYFQCDEHEKIQWEAARWSNAFDSALAKGRDDHRLQHISNALHGVLLTQQQHDVTVLFARTLRMLLFYEWALLDNECSLTNPYRHAPAYLRKSLSQPVAELAKVKADVLIPRDGRWKVSLPLLLLLAIGMSQCEYYQPFAWEAYSAGRARDELRRRWTSETPHRVGKKGRQSAPIAQVMRILNTVALLIRCQSGVGQSVRQTGSTNFLDLVTKHARQLIFGDSQLFKVLRLLAFIEEARNHRAPLNLSKDPFWQGRSFSINAGLGEDENKSKKGSNRDHRNLSSPVVKKRIRGYLAFNPTNARKVNPVKGAESLLTAYTWSYTGARYFDLPDNADSSKDIRAFKYTVLDAEKRFRLRTEKSPTPPEYENISIGRVQVHRPLQELLRNIVQHWHKLPEDQRRNKFDRLFRLKTLEVPHPFDPDLKEYTLQILLRDDLAAERLLFPGEKVEEVIKKTEINDQTTPAIDNSGALFRYLLDKAREKMSLDADRLWAESKTSAGLYCYVPFSLARRILDVVHRLRPDDCLTLPIGIDRSPSEWIYIPYGIREEDELSKRVIANFILASVLNRAMAAGLSRADIDLNNLTSPSLPSAHHGQGILGAEQWRSEIQALYKTGGYDVLLDHYLRDYNTPRRNIQFVTSQSPATRIRDLDKEMLVVGNLHADLDRFLQAQRQSASPAVCQSVSPKPQWQGTARPASPNTPAEMPSKHSLRIEAFGGTLQTTRLGVRFPEPLKAIVLGAGGRPKKGVRVTFSIIGSGDDGEKIATAEFCRQSSNSTRRTGMEKNDRVTVRTDRDGIATSPPLRATLRAGICSVRAQTPENLGTLFSLTSTADFWLFGVDIGGTLTKCQLFAFRTSDNNEPPICLHQGSVFRMPTPPSPGKDSGGTKEYVRRLIDLVKERLAWELKVVDHSRLVIGVSWPGPVRENHIAGTSGALQHFGSFSRNIPDNRIDDVWKIDIAGAISEVWKNEFKQIPFVSLLNDGDAEAVGDVVLAGSSAGQQGRHSQDITLSVVKLGTGLAGAILTGTSDSLALVPGLYEWGKIILDVGAPPRPRDEGTPPPHYSYPQGVAAEYLSKRCLPQLAKQRGGQYFQKDNPDSAEIGLVLEVATNQIPEAYKSLRAECGAIQAERRPPWGVPVSAEVLRRVYKNPKSDPNLLFEVRLALKEFETATKSLVEHIDNYGRTRLERLIGYAPRGHSSIKDEMRDLSMKQEFRGASQVALTCVQILGRYLGDFCVLLHDQCNVNKVMLTGGVLTGVTGTEAIKHARERIRLYGLNMLPAEEHNSFHIYEQLHGATRASFSGQEPKQEQTFGNIERGAFGAACFATASLLQSKKQDGLQKLRSMLLPLVPGEHVELDRTLISTSRKDEKLDFANFALSYEDLLTFLDSRGPDWHLYRTDGGALPAQKASFVRY